MTVRVGHFTHHPEFAVAENGDIAIAWVAEGVGVQAIESGDGGLTWSSPSTLMPVDDRAERVVDLRIAATARGRFAVVWNIASVGSFVVQVATGDVEHGWSPPTTLSDALLWAWNPRIVPHGLSSFSVVWAWAYEGRLPGDRCAVIQVATSEDAGLSWSQPRTVSRAGQEVTEPQLAVDSAGRVLAAWNFVDFGGGTCSVQIARSGPPGTPWSAPIALSPGHEEAWLRALVTGGGAIGVFWESHVLRCSVSNDCGATWEVTDPSPPVAAVRSYSEFSATTVNGDRVVAAWSEFTSTGIQVAVSSDAGSTWMPEVTLSAIGAEASSYLPSVTAAPDGTVIVVWFDADPARRPVHSAVSRDGGASWSSTSSLGLPGRRRQARVPQLTWSDDALILRWVAVGGRSLSAVRSSTASDGFEDAVICECRSLDQGATWGDPIELSRRQRLRAVL